MVFVIHNLIMKIEEVTASWFSLFPKHKDATHHPLTQHLNFRGLHAVVLFNWFDMTGS